jgi:hypothetical protein
VQAKTSGLLSSNYLMGVVPFCTVTIYMTGTTTIAATTPQTPLKATANGSIPPIYAATGIAYDVKFSGGYSPNTYTTPVTRTGVMAGGADGGGSPGGSNTDVQVNVLGSFGGYSTLTYDPADGLCIGGCPSGYGVSIGPLGTMTSSWNFDTTNPLTAIDSLTGSGTTDYVWTWNGSTGQWEANSGSAGVTSITPGTNTNCTPLVDGVCTGPVTISAAAATSVATTTQSASATYYPVFVPANSSSNQAVSVGPMSYNPGTGTLSTSQYISTVATGTAPLTVTSTTPVANLSIGGTAANVTATSNATLSTLSALSLPYSQLSGTIPTWNQNTTGTSASSTNLLGGAVGSAPYQSALNTTAFLASPITSGHTFVYSWQPLGSPISPVAYDLTPIMTLAGNSVQISGSSSYGNVGCWVTYASLGPCSSAQIQTALGSVYAPLTGAAFTGPVSAPNLTFVVLNVAALRALNCVPGVIYKTQGYYTESDNASGDYVCNGSDTSTADNGGTIIAASNSYRYYLIHDRGVDIKMFGAYGDNTHYDTTAISNAILGAQGNNGYGVTYFDAGHTYLFTPLTFDSLIGITLKGGNGGDEMNLAPGASAGAAVLSCTASSSKVVTSVTSSGGSGMTPGTYPLAFSGGAGTGAAGSITVGASTVTGINITSQGTGYTSAPTVTTATGGTAPTLTATIQEQDCLSFTSNAYRADKIVFEDIALYGTTTGYIASFNGVSHIELNRVMVSNSANSVAGSGGGLHFTNADAVFGNDLFVWNLGTNLTTGYGIVIDSVNPLSTSFLAGLYNFTNSSVYGWAAGLNVGIAGASLPLSLGYANLNWTFGDLSHNGAGAQLLYGTKSATIQGSYIEGNTYAGVQIADGATSVTLKGNFFNGANSSQDILLGAPGYLGTSWGIFNNIAIEGNHHLAVNQYGIYSQDEQPGSDFSVKDEDFNLYTAGAVGISVNEYTAHTSFNTGEHLTFNGFALGNTIQGNFFSAKGTTEYNSGGTLIGGNADAVFAIALSGANYSITAYDAQNVTVTDTNASSKIYTVQPVLSRGRKQLITNSASSTVNLPVYNYSGTALGTLAPGKQAFVSNDGVSDYYSTVGPVLIGTCGTTSTCSNTSQASPRIVWGTVALSGGTITVGSMTAWTSTSTFGCTCTDTSTTAASCTVQNTSSSSITIKGTSTDTVTYMCVGN